MLLTGFVALVVSLAMQPLATSVLRRNGLLDAPSARSSHLVATPRGGGVVVVAAVLIAGLFHGRDGSSAAILLATALAATVGLVEDVVGVPLARRFLLLVVAVAPLALLPSLGHERAALAGAVALVYAVSLVNAVNFMDGINGISAAIGVAAGGAYTLMAPGHGGSTLAAVGASVVGASLGFAPYNVPRARVFLGDSGSYGLGAALAGLGIALWGNGLGIEAALAPLTVYLVDTATTLVRRVRGGEAWYLPHRTHVYQRLIDLGLSHAQVSGIVFVLSCSCAALGAVGLRGPVMRVLADLLIGVLLLSYLCLPGVATRWRNRRQSFRPGG